MIGSDIYCVRQAAVKLTKALQLLDEARDAVKHLSEETLAGLEAKNVSPRLRDIIREAVELRHGLTVKSPPATNAKIVGHIDLPPAGESKKAAV